MVLRADRWPEDNMAGAERDWAIFSGDLEEDDDDDDDWAIRSAHLEERRTAGRGTVKPTKELKNHIQIKSANVKTNFPDKFCVEKYSKSN